jgi:hypothetical protein
LKKALRVREDMAEAAQVPPIAFQVLMLDLRSKASKLLRVKRRGVIPGSRFRLRSPHVFLNKIATGMAILRIARDPARFGPSVQSRVFKLGKAAAGTLDFSRLNLAPEALKVCFEPLPEPIVTSEACAVEHFIGLAPAHDPLPGKTPIGTHDNANLAACQRSVKTSH